MARVLKTAPVRMASDPSSGAIAHWKHGALHDVVEPMTDHVVMTYTGRATAGATLGKSVAIGTARSGVVTIIPAGSAPDGIFPGLSMSFNSISRRQRSSASPAKPIKAHRTTPGANGHPDPTTSRLLLSAADVLEGMRAAGCPVQAAADGAHSHAPAGCHTGSPATFQPTLGGLSPTALRRAIERLRSDSDADVSLAALAADAGLSRFHFCRAFKQSTGLSPHAWLRQHRLEQAMTMLRETDASVVSVAMALGYASQTAFAAAFRRLTGQTPSDWRRRTR